MITMNNLKATITILGWLILITFFDSIASAQSIPSPGEAQSQPIALVGGTLHIGNGEVIENGTVLFSNGKIAAVGSEVELPENAVIQQLNGKDVYPGFISPGTRMGLTEIGAVRATNDYRDVGKFNPSLRSIIAYNTDSWATPTYRSNGILLAQVRPWGGIVSGQSSIVQLDGWNWEDAAYATDEGIWLNWPSLYVHKGWWAEPGPIERNKKYETIEEIKLFFKEAKAYCQSTGTKEKNLKFEAMCGLFDDTKKLYVAASQAKQIIAAVNLTSELDIDMIAVGGRESYLVADLLKQHKIPVILQRTHSLPPTKDSDIDIIFRLPKMLEDAGILYCMSAEIDHGEPRNLPFTAGKAVAYGLTKEQALSSITSNTAKIMGIDKRTGTLEVGKDANIIVSKGDVLDILTNHIEMAFIQGRVVNLGNKQKDLYRKYMDKYGLEYKQH